MHFENVHQLLEDQRFKRVIWRKQRLSLFFSLLIIFLFFGFILVIAFAPDMLSVKVVSDGVINIYLLFSVGLIILICVLMNIFIGIKAKDEHEDIHELIKVLREEQK